MAGRSPSKSAKIEEGRGSRREETPEEAMERVLKEVQRSITQLEEARKILEEMVKAALKRT